MIIMNSAANSDAYVEVSSNAGKRQVSLDAALLADRKIFINESIDANLANRVIKQLMWCRKAGGEPVNIYFNSPGGEVTSGLAIYDYMQSSNLQINTWCMGMAASMAAILFTAGTKGHRFILPHSKTMIHEPSLCGNISGNADTIRHTAEDLLETQMICNEILARHTGRTIEEIVKATSYDNIMNAKQSIAFGLCDKEVSWTE